MSSTSQLRPAVRRAEVPILRLCGADAVGKSTVAWEVYSRLASQGVAAACVDTNYLGFCTPRFPDHARLVELTLAAAWPNYCALVASGNLQHGIRPPHAEVAPAGRTR